MAAAIRALSKDASSTTKKSLNVVLDAFDRGITVEDKDKIMAALEEIKKKDKPLFQQLYNLTMTGVYQGVVANFVYDWVVPLSQKL